MSEARRRAEMGIPYCHTHHEGCPKYRIPNPSIWGHKTESGKWFTTPGEALDSELSHLTNQLYMVTGSELPYEEFRREFLSWPCKVKPMPIAEYGRKFGKQSTEVDTGLAALLARGRVGDVPDTFRPAFEEVE
ncbi:hypothetical protein ABZX30_29880 [Streptomyces sp. NPDC004542]|uniref:hypothetical protein n=1 Tax=Streptomyces sp. NPDC004542 TaxID=3154281 RepID=UPI0033A8535B